MYQKTAAILMIAASAARAQFQSNGSDVLPTVSNGKIVTGAHDDNTGVDVTNVKVYVHAFQTDPDDPYFTQDPGFNAPANSGLPSGSTFGFTILSSLTYWSGNGPVVMLPLPAGESLKWTFGSASATVMGMSGAQPGFALGSVASNQSIHKHLNAFLQPGPAESVPTNGIYFVAIAATDSVEANSDPLYMVFDNGLSTTQHDYAQTYVRNAFYPYTNLVGETATPATWSGSGSGTWSTSTNWNGAVPSTAGDRAIFGQSITTASTVTLASPQTVGHIDFDNASAYTIAGAALTIGDGVAPADISVLSGSHSISAPLNLVSPTTFTMSAAASTLTLTGAISATSVGIAKAGAGTLVLPNVRAASLIVAGGTVRQAANGGANGTSILGSLQITAGQFDLNDNDLIINFSGPSPISTIRSYLATGYNAGAWNGAGLDSTAAHNDQRTALAIGDNAELGYSTFDGQAVTANSLLVKYTYYGDSTLDGKVDLGNDFNLFLIGFLNGGSTWTHGDYNYDGVVNAADFQLFVDGYKAQGSSLGSLDQMIASTPALSVAQKSELLGIVPEPAMPALATVCACIGAVRRKKRAASKLPAASTT